MKLAGRWRIEIEGDTAALVGACGRDQRLIGYLMQRLLTGEEAAVDELSTWGIAVREIER